MIGLYIFRFYKGDCLNNGKEMKQYLPLSAVIKFICLSARNRNLKDFLIGTLYCISIIGGTILFSIMFILLLLEIDGKIIIESLRNWGSLG
jgi:hypothetical protein